MADERGQAFTEYAIMALFMTVVIGGTIPMFENLYKSLYTSTALWIARPLP